MFCMEIPRFVMPRSDRLFDLIQILRDGRLHNAADMAGQLGVSVRTIWRDMATLMVSGMPVEGERGVGYILRAPITLPPMVLTSAELEAFRLGVRMVAEGADPGMARAARSLASKIGAVTPAPPQDDDGLFVLTSREATRAAPHMPMLRAAIRAQERLTITYLDVEGVESHRDIRPLQLEFWGRVWTLAAWCEARRDFRAFRVDRIRAITPTGETFPQEPGRDLAAWRDRSRAGEAP
jgi:predicted DNA-binding transcriptional regulator YafY